MQSKKFFKSWEFYDEGVKKKNHHYKGAREKKNSDSMKSESSVNHFVIL